MVGGFPPVEFEWVVGEACAGRYREDLVAQGRFLRFQVIDREAETIEVVEHDPQCGGGPQHRVCAGVHVLERVVTEIAPGSSTVVADHPALRTA